MKNYLWILLLSFAVSVAAAQNGTTTATFAVKGNCGECKERIENAADIKGVKLCSWDKKTGIATVTFDPTRTSLDKIEQAVAARGHDAGPYKSTDAAYKKLPECCKYRDTGCKEPTR